MKYHLADSDLAIGIDFMVNGDAVVPEVDSVKATLRGQDGTPKSGWNNKAITTLDTSTSVSIVVEASANAVVTSPESRVLVVTFLHQGSQYEIRRTYMVTEWLNIAATPDQVRAYYGLTSREIPDEDVCFERLFFKLTKDIDRADLDALFADSETALDANRLLVLMSCAEMVPSLQLRLKQSERSDQVQYLRLFKLDFDRITKDIAGEIASLLDDLAITDEVQPVLLALSQPTDPVTGV
jgi:hypothetical protein